MSPESKNDQEPTESDETSADTRSGRGNEPGYVSVLRAIDRSLGVVEQTLLVVFLVVLIGIGVIQAVMIKFSSGLGFWSFTALRYSVFFIAMTGAALSAHTGQLIAMDFVTRALTPMSRARLQVVLRLVTVAVCVLLVLGGLELRENVVSQPDASIDPRTGVLALPLGAALMAIHVSLHIIIDLSYLLRGRVPPERFGLEGSAH